MPSNGTFVTDCGDTTHDPDCLCDVIIIDPTPINYGLTDVWHGDAIARAIGVGVPWKHGDVADFGDALLKAYDIWSRPNRRGERIEGEVLRLKVLDLLRTGESMTVIPRLLDVPYKDIMHAMTNGVPATVWAWDEMRWLTAEAIIHDHFSKHGCEVLIDMLGGNLHHCVIDQLADWYGVKVNEKAQDRLTLMRKVLTEGAHPLDAYNHFTSLGIACSKEQVYMMRKRMVKNGMVSPVMPSRSPVTV